MRNDQPNSEDHTFVATTVEIKWDYLRQTFLSNPSVRRFFAAFWNIKMSGSAGSSLGETSKRGWGHQERPLFQKSHDGEGAPSDTVSNSTVLYSQGQGDGGGNSRVKLGRLDVMLPKPPFTDLRGERGALWTQLPQSSLCWLGSRWYQREVGFSHLNQFESLEGWEPVMLPLNLWSAAECHHPRGALRQERLWWSAR